MPVDPRGRILAEINGELATSTAIVTGAEKSPWATGTHAGRQFACLASPLSPPQAVHPFVLEESISFVMAIFRTMSFAWMADKTVPIPINRVKDSTRIEYRRRRVMAGEDANEWRLTQEIIITV